MHWHWRYISFVLSLWSLRDFPSYITFFLVDINIFPQWYMSGRCWNPRWMKSHPLSRVNWQCLDPSLRTHLLGKWKDFYPHLENPLHYQLNFMRYILDWNGLFISRPGCCRQKPGEDFLEWEHMNFERHSFEYHSSRSYWQKINIG